MQFGLQLILFPALIQLGALVTVPQNRECVASEPVSTCDDAAARAQERDEVVHDARPSNVVEVSSILSNSLLQNAMTARRITPVLESDGEGEHAPPTAVEEGSHMTVAPMRVTASAEAEALMAETTATEAAATAQAAAAVTDDLVAHHTNLSSIPPGGARSTGSHGSNVSENTLLRDADKLFRGIARQSTSAVGCFFLSLAWLATPPKLTQARQQLFVSWFVLPVLILLLLGCLCLVELLWWAPARQRTKQQQMPQCQDHLQRKQQQQQLQQEQQHQQRQQLRQEEFSERWQCLSLPAPTWSRPLAAALQPSSVMTMALRSHRGPGSQHVACSTPRVPRPSMGAVLMHDLVVPSGRECVLLLPRLPQASARLCGRKPVSTLNGISVFDVTFGDAFSLSISGEGRNEAESGDRGRKGRQCLSLQSIEAGALFAVCYESPELDPYGKDCTRQQIEIMGGPTGKPFGVVSWSKAAQNTFSVVSKTTQKWEIHFQEPFHESTVHATDGTGLLLATFDSTNGLDTDPWHRIATIAPFVDAGLLVTAALSAEILLHNASIHAQ